MDQWKKALAALNAIYNLLDRDSTSLKQDFDSETQEHIITLEYRCRGSFKAMFAHNDVEQLPYVPLLRSLIDSD